jgi:hypothetical protein
LVETYGVPLTIDEEMVINLLFLLQRNKTRYSWGKSLTPTWLTGERTCSVTLGAPLVYL